MSKKGKTGSWVWHLVRLSLVLSTLYYSWNFLSVKAGFIQPQTNQWPNGSLHVKKEFGWVCGLWFGTVIFFPRWYKTNQIQSKQEINRSGVFLSPDGSKAPLWERNLKCEWWGLEAADVFVQLMWPQTLRQTNDWLKDGLSLVLRWHTNRGMSNTDPDKSLHLLLRSWFYSEE